MLAALWWAWTTYAWLTKHRRPEEEVVGAALLVALVAMFVAALAVPGVFDDEGALFGAAFLVVCSMHATLYALDGRACSEVAVGSSTSSRGESSWNRPGSVRPAA